MKQNSKENAVSKSDRRSFLGKGAAAAAGVGLAASTEAVAKPKAQGKKVYYKDGKKPEKTPMFSSLVSYGNLLFVSGRGAHFEGDITAHTEHVLAEIKEALESAGSSMDKVLKASVFLANSKDFEGMNKVFLGKFGDEPPVRTTIAAAWIPGNSLVEIDVIAYI
jgi:enamine deaminase RidA (YjgF/YER057c/UK114 family)